MNEVVYLGSMFSRNGRYEMDVERCIAAGNKVNGALAALMRRRNVCTAARLAVHNAVLVKCYLKMTGSNFYVWFSYNLT